MIFEEKTVSSDIKYNGRIIDVRVDTVLMPDGKKAYRDIVDHPGGVGVVPITDAGEIILVRQYRKAIEKAIYEIPAGKLDSGEPHYECGVRELEEETGYKANDFIYLGHMYPSPGFANEITYLYLAKSLYKGVASLDEDEYLDIISMPANDVLTMILNNEINDAKTIVGIFKALEHLKSM